MGGFWLNWAVFIHLPQVKKQHSLKSQKANNNDPMMIKQKASKSHALLILLSITIFILFFSYLAIMRHERLQSMGYDLGVYDQAIWNTAHGRIFEFSEWRGKDNWFIEPGTMLGQHFEPILFLAVPLYWLWADVRALLILQAVIVAMGAVGIWLLARWRYRDAAGRLSRLDAWAALILAFAFLLHPAIQSLTLDDFHSIAFATGLMPFTLYFMLRRRYKWFMLFAILTMMVKEDMPIMVAFMGLYILFIQGFREKERSARPKAFAVGSGVFILGMLWAALAFLVIIPHYNVLDASPYLWRYKAILGDDGLTLVTFPHIIFAALKTLLGSRALSYAAGVMLPMAFLCLFDLPLLLIGGFSFMMNAASAFDPQQSLVGHYSASLTPLIVAATVTGIANLTRFFRREDHFLAKWTPARIKKAPAQRWHFILALVVLLFTLHAQRLDGFTPLAQRFTWPIINKHQRLAQRFFDQIPADASVSAPQMLNPHLTHRRQITILPYDRSGDYYLIDILRNWPNDTPAGQQWLLDNIVHAPGYGIVDAADGLMLLRKGAPQRPVPPEFYDVFRVKAPQPQFSASVDFGDAIRFLGFDINQRDGGPPTFDLYFQPRHPLKKDYFITLYLADQSYQPLGAIETTQSALLWFPTSRWQPGESVKIPFRTIPWDVSQLESWSVALGVLDGEQVWAQDSRLKPVIHAYSQNPRLLNADTLLNLMRFRRNGDRIEPLPDPVLLEPPHSATPAASAFDDLATLEAYTLSPASLRPGQALSLTLYWRVQSATNHNYSVFTQLLGPDGQLHGQHDSPPGNGTLPTYRWLPNQLLPDEHHFRIAVDAPPGDYQLLAGFYDPVNGQRIALKDGSGDYWAIPLRIQP